MLDELVRNSEMEAFWERAQGAGAEQRRLAPVFTHEQIPTRMQNKFKIYGFLQLNPGLLEHIQSLPFQVRHLSARIGVAAPPCGSAALRQRRHPGLISLIAYSALPCLLALFVSIAIPAVPTGSL